MVDRIHSHRCRRQAANPCPTAPPATWAFPCTPWEAQALGTGLPRCPGCGKTARVFRRRGRPLVGGSTGLGTARYPSPGHGLGHRVGLGRREHKAARCLAPRQGLAHGDVLARREHRVRNRPLPFTWTRIGTWVWDSSEGAQG